MRALLPAAILAALAASSAPVWAASTHVHIQGFAFDAGTVTLSPGDSVTWDNHDGASHTVTSDDNRFPSSPTLGKGASHTATFAAAGSFAYHCAIHPSMRGRVEVVEATAANRPPAVRIDFPQAQGVVRGIVEFVGVATDPDGDALTVELRIDDQPFRPVEGINPWRYRWDSATAGDGPHKATVQAADGAAGPVLATVEFRVSNANPNATAGPVRIEPLMVRPSPVLLVGETVTVIAPFTSLVNATQTFPVRFLVLGAERGRQDLTLPAHGHGEAKFRFVGEQPGMYEVAVEAPSFPVKSVGTLDVISGRPAAPVEEASGGKIVIPAPHALLAALAAVALAVARRRG